NGSTFNLNESSGAFVTNFFNMDYIGEIIPFGRLDIAGIAIEDTNDDSPLQITSRSNDEIKDNYAPLFTSAPATSNITISGADVTFQADEPGTFYYYALVDGTTAPTSAEVITNGVSESYTEVGSNVVVTVVGLMDNTAYDVYVLVSDDETTPNVQDTPTLLEFTTLEAANDTDSDIVAPVTQVAVGTVSSLATDEASAVDVFAFDVVDAGTTDGLPTIIQSIQIVPGLNNSADWSTRLGGAVLSDGTSNYTGNITADDITFDLSAAPVNVADNSTTSFTLSVWLANTVTDEEVLEFQIPLAHTFIVDAENGSAIQASLSDIVTSNLQTIEVIATTLELDAPSSVALNTDFSLTVTATDANDNIDLAIRSLTVSLGTGSGNLSSSGGLANRTMTNGTFTWDDLQIDQAGDFTLAVGDGSLNAVTATITSSQTIGGVFFSEYFEGSSNNKAIEIYNGTGASLDLSSFSVKQSNNGAGFDNGSANDGSFPEAYELPLSGSLEAGEVLVIVNGSASLTELNDAGDIFESFGDTQGDRIAAFNGDDALGLFQNGVLIDLIGDPGVDPGSAWDVAGTSEGTREHTLVRKGSITSGNTTPLGSFGTNVDDSEWVVYDQNDVTFIGYHLLD
ncbi:MAG: lamin tail domain-containing protein, partial [Bacteroidota bacterium]